MLTSPATTRLTKLITHIFVDLSLVVILASPATAQNTSANSGSAASGIPNQIAALQQQIEENTALILELQSQLNPDVSGSTYRAYYQNNKGTVLNYVQMQASRIFNRAATITFNTDGTANWQRDECLGLQLDNPDYEIDGQEFLSTISKTSWDFCGETLDINYLQTGNQLILEVVNQDNEVTAVIDDLWVSSTGEVIFQAKTEWEIGIPIPPEFCGGPEQTLPCTSDRMRQYMRFMLRLD